MEPTTEKTRWRDRVKNNIKANEIQKTVVSFWQEHREAIIVGAVCVVATGIIAKKDPQYSASIRTLVQVGDNTNVNSVTHNHMPKRLSYIVTDGERWWQTQTAAASALGERSTDVSKHLNHGQVLKSGAKLERVGVRS